MGGIDVYWTDIESGDKDGVDDEDPGSVCGFLAAYY